MKAYRIKDGYFYIFEGTEDEEGVFIREFKYKKIPKKDGKTPTICNFAEALVNNIQNDNKIVYNLK